MHIQIPCNQCFNFYIRKTFKTLEIRTKQQKANVGNANENGVFSICQNIIKWEECFILFNLKEFYIRNILEIIILKNTFDYMNLNTGLFNIDNIIEREHLKRLKLNNTL